MAKVKIQIPTVNEKLLERYIRHSVYLEQLKIGEAKLISRFLKQKAFPQIYEKLIGELGKVKNLETIGSIYKIRRLKRMLAATQKISTAGMVKAEKMLVGRLMNISKFEAKWNADMISKTVPLDIDMSMPSNEVLKNLVTMRPMDGHKLGTWMKGYSTAVRVAMTKQIKVGIATGESLPTIAKRINKALGYKAKQAEAIARTAVSNVVHQAREEVFKRNKDIVRKVQWIATLDDRTTLICINFDGRMFDVGYGERPPAHFNCRSTIVPVTPSWQEFGVTDPPAATRASMNGAVPAKMTYKTWLKKQPKAVQIKVLGKKRAELYRSGRVKIDKFVGKDLKPLTLKQLAKREGISLEKPELLPAPPQIKAMSVKGTGKKLLTRELKAIEDWSFQGSQNIINSQLNMPMERGWDLAYRPDAKKAAINLRKAINKIKSFEGTVYRGMRFDSDAARQIYLSKLRVGEVWKSKTFMSTSKSSSVATKFSEALAKTQRGVILEIRSKSGRLIAKYSPKPEEFEVLFRKGTPFKVDKIVGNKVYLSEITKQAQLKAIPAPPTVIKAIPTKAIKAVITQVEKDAIYSYGAGASNQITRFQLGKSWEVYNWGTKRMVQTIRNIESGMAKLPGYSGTSYRGLAFKTAEARTSFLSQFTQGKVWKSKAFQSTSKSSKMANRFMKSMEFKAKGVKLHIDGSSGRYISDYAKTLGEQEVLFKKGTSFKVIRVKGNEVWLKEITKQAQLKAIPAPPPITVTKVGRTFTQTTSKEFNKFVNDTIDAYPEDVKAALNKRGISYKTGSRLTEIRPDLAGQQPRGWAPGTTWDSVEGLYDKSAKSISISETSRPIGQKVYKKVSINRIKGVINHETGHGFDVTPYPKSVPYSNTVEFKTAYARDVASLSKSDMAKNDLRYFLQKDSPGRQETFAEIFADTMGQKAGWTDVKKFFPNSAKYVDDILKVKVVPKVAVKITIVPKITAVPKIKIKIVPKIKIKTKIVPKGLLKKKLADPEVQSLIKDYSKAKRKDIGLYIRRAEEKLATKGIYIDVDGNFTTRQIQLKVAPAPPKVPTVKKEVVSALKQSDKITAKTYTPVGEGLKTYDKTLRLASPEAKSMMKRVGKSKGQIYKDIIKNRKLSLEAGSTKERYFGVNVKREVTLKRAKLHDKLLRQILDKVEPSENPRALLTGGLPGFGKSGILDASVPKWKTQYVHVDSDSIKLMLAKADGLTSLGTDAAAYHEEANLILGRVFAKAIKENKSILFDSTMRNSSRINKLISELRNAGYDITAVYADLPLEKSMIRSIGRSYGKTGRFVDPMMQTTHGTKNIDTFNMIKEKVDDWKIFDTDVAFGDKPILIGSK